MKITRWTFGLRWAHIAKHEATADRCDEQADLLDEQIEKLEEQAQRLRYRAIEHRLAAEQLRNVGRAA